MPDLVQRIRNTFSVIECDTTAYMYDGMESQAGFALPVIHVPFDSGCRGHWADEGQILDFALAAESDEKRVLDFGPGDGWPSLRIAPLSGEIVGVDASRRRVEACTENAVRLGIDNASFVHSPAGETLPFPAESFDAVVAASAVEQTPDPFATLTEFHRVLKPGGKLRLFYEDLDRYRGGREVEVAITSKGAGDSALEIYDRDPDAEHVHMIRIFVGVGENGVCRRLGWARQAQLDERDLTQEALEKLQDLVTEIRYCRAHHPSGSSYVRMMREIGFREVRGTRGGGEAAQLRFDDKTGVFSTHEQVSKWLRPIVAAAVQSPAPIELNPNLSAVK